MLSTTNALNQTTSYTYSAALGDLLAITTPRNHTTSFASNGASRRTQVTDANGKVTQTTRDVLDRIPSVTRSLGATPVVTSFQYDPEGSRRFLTDPLHRTWE